jgi:hypothetical protein
MSISVISLEKMNRIVEYDLKAWHIMIEDKDNSDIDRIGEIVSYLIIHHIETGIGQMHREDRDLINTAITRGYDSDTVNIVGDRLRKVYINTLRNRISRIDQLGDVLKRELDVLGVDYIDDGEDDE